VTDAVLIVSLVSSAMLCGLIWFVQVVHYPLFAAVGTEEFAAYHRRHLSRTTWVVAPLMLLEAATACWLLWSPPAGMGLWVNGLQWGLAGAVWGLTFFVQVPLHGRLSLGFDGAVIAQLVRGNVSRVVLWSVRVVLLAVWMLGG